MLTSEQYLEIERKAERKSEYFNGNTYPMAGVGYAHVLINSNVGFVLRRGIASGCRVLSSSLKLCVKSIAFYTYPDLLVICGRPEFADHHKDIVTNPKVIVEILSSATQSYDRGDKFAHYRKVSSLRDYLMISQDRRQAEHWVMQSDGGWLFHEVSGADAIITLESIGVRFNLSEAYDGVEL
jgi:Uma2 family endonuclease